MSTIQYHNKENTIFFKGSDFVAITYANFIFEDLRSLINLIFEARTRLTLANKSYI